jgi:hypothetical protein
MEGDTHTKNFVYVSFHITLPQMTFFLLALPTKAKGTA